MTFGTIYSYPQNPRVAKALIAAQYTGVEIAQPEFAMGKENKTPEFTAKFPTGQVPAFENDKVQLFESNAIAHYVASQGESKLLGANAEEAAQVLQWLFYTSNQLEEHIGAWIYPILGFVAYDKTAHNKAVQGTKSALALLDKVLLKKTFLVGEHITLADIVVACTLVMPVKMVLAPEYLVANKNLARYLKTLYAQPQFKAVLGDVAFCTAETKYTPAKEAAKPAATEQPAEPAKKPKSKLELLPPSSFNLEEWKRFYSNNDTKPTAMNWFWEHFDAEGFSIWRVVYKYNDELTKVFMSSNLIGGFFARLERARKYAFGSLCVLGEDNKNEIEGYFVIRGQEIPEEVTDAADFESYSFTKVDNLADEKFREDLADAFAWEGKFNGKTFADAKVFK
ncbi:hypothetical protein SYNPS1DRAFT_33112 [Syncephalis pseudoplumigaleata]|uniref:Elongation factor 1-gamma n=1 Tax=Syncephalis pseudoplumigaleata TaxID=1712513 RepID=A0A4P9YXP0_9FUNG|nr:hypothetical protein SYNPS1DRAFT_33112 [Syncephalis pseudoplumigaleata]|eukprot:RKP24893.1 hypothetical protein SYNPS1DRAFT_33112 [Syncephalis pseudoplumigaleata]